MLLFNCEIINAEIKGGVRYNLNSALCLLCRSLFLIFNVMCTQNNMTTSVSNTHKMLRHGCQQKLLFHLNPNATVHFSRHVYTNKSIVLTGTWMLSSSLMFHYESK